MIKIRRNAYLLSVLKERDKSGNKVFELDDDDYLDPKRCIDAHDIGIDVEFMVRHLGGDFSSSFTETDP